MNSVKKKTLVLGASAKPGRYAKLAVQRLHAHGYEVVAVGKHTGNVDGIEITSEVPELHDIDTVTLYLNPANQQEYYDTILSIHPKRIIFNPGTENPELMQMAEKNNIETLEACTLVMLSTGQY